MSLWMMTSVRESATVIMPGQSSQSSIEQLPSEYGGNE